jgi:hypothetical protein
LELAAHILDKRAGTGIFLGIPRILFPDPEGMG